MNTTDLIAFYVNLLIAQFNSKARAKGTVQAVITEAVANQIISQVRDGFDLETAMGKQLDILGSYRGARRMTPGLDLGRTYFATIGYGEATPADWPGFATYADVDTVNWFFRSYPDDTNPSYTLTDDEMRRLIKYLARVHESNHSLQDLDDIFSEFFGAYVTVADGANMTITIHHGLTDTDTLFYIVHSIGALPRPAGVTVTVTES